MPAPSVHAFAEKVALVTDAATPIGRAVALQLALDGCYVVVGFPANEAAAKVALDELKNLGTLAHHVAADVSTVAGAETLVAEVGNLYGRIDFLINCLKPATDSTFINTTETNFEGTLGNSLKSAFFVTQAALELMSARPKPRIVNIISACDGAESEKNIAFVAAQKAIAGMTASLAQTLPKKFRVNAIEVSEKPAETKENLDAELFRPPAGFSSDDAARAILFLLSADAVGLNGQILKVG